MSTIENAMRLLDVFGEERPEIGLSEFRAFGGRDKATTYRYLCALEAAGMVERNPLNRRYRVGPAVLRLARLRERTVPRRATVADVLPRLANETGETAHCAALEGTRLLTLECLAAKVHSTRVVIEEAELPLHATGSGIAVLAFRGDMMATARAGLHRFTEATAVDAAALSALVAEARRTGFGVSRQGFERGVHGIAAPLFGEDGAVAGSIAVASVASRMTPTLAATIRRELIHAARRITDGWGGTIPDALEAAWANPATVDWKIEQETGAGR